MKLINNTYRIVFIGLIAALFTGCASFQSMSSYARTGDTVTITLGGTEDNNALVEVLKKEGLTVTITDSALMTYPIKLRHLFRVYPDHTSKYTFNTKYSAGGNGWDSYVPPLLGEWMATVDLIDPAVPGVALPLAVGPATISVSSTEQLAPTVYYGNNYEYTNADLGSISVEILPGQGTPNNLNYIQPVSHDPLTSLEPMPQIIVSPSGAPAAAIAGGSFKFVYNPANFTGGLMAVQANHDPNVQLMSKATLLPSGEEELIVTVLNPKGFLNHNNREQGVMGIGNMSPLRSVRFNLVYKDTAVANDDATWHSYIQMVSGEYIDMAGDAVAAITPVMKKTR